METTSAVPTIDDDAVEPTRRPPAGASPGKLVYGKEPKLFAISLVISLVVWIGLLVGTLGTALIWLLILFISYLFLQSAFISYLKGTAVEITSGQFPELHQRIRKCCARVGVTKPPRAYLLNGEGMLNALATRFLGHDFLVLFSDVVDALKTHPQSLNFYIGHELGHIHRKHLTWGPILWPASILPLLGSAYSRAREYTCDSYGQACCERPADAAFGLAVLAAGPNKWSAVDVPQYAGQAEETGAFWMSFHELIGDYPWLVKRMERVRARATHAAPELPRRHLGAWLLALFIPRVAGGGIAGAVVGVAMLGILAAVAIPAYQDYVAQAESAAAFAEADQVRERVSDYIIENQAFPSSLVELGFDESYQSEHVARINLENQQLEFVLSGSGPLEGRTIIYEPYVDEGQLYWDCTAGTLPEKYRTEGCL